MEHLLNLNARLQFSSLPCYNSKQVWRIHALYWLRLIRPYLKKKEQLSCDQSTHSSKLKRVHVSTCMMLYCDAFKAGLSLVSSRGSSINLSDNVKDRLCSARNATTIASILAALSRMCTVGIGGTSVVLDGDVEASQYAGGAPYMTLLPRAYSLQE